MTERLADRVARRILEHIHAQGLPEGRHLAAQELADLFKVSRAPITAALRTLEATGAVQSVPNRGFFVGPAAGEIPPPPVESDEHELYDAIVDARLAETIPERASENELMRYFGVSRGALQRTLTRIAEEGWVERLPGHGWLFSTTLHTTQAYEQAYRFRGVIETYAVLQPGFAVVPEELERLRAEQNELLAGAVDVWPRARLFEINSGLHETIAGWSGNPFFADALRRVNRQRRLIEFRVNLNPDRLRQQCREHLTLLDLIERGDMLLAADFLRNHVGHAIRAKEWASQRLFA